MSDGSIDAGPHLLRCLGPARLGNLSSPSSRTYLYGKRICPQSRNGNCCTRQLCVCCTGVETVGATERAVEKTGRNCVMRHLARCGFVLETHTAHLPNCESRKHSASCRSAILIKLFVDKDAAQRECLSCHDVMFQAAHARVEPHSTELVFSEFSSALSRCWDEER